MKPEPAKTIGTARTAHLSDQTLAAPNLLTVKQFSLAHPAFTASSLRNLIFKAGSRYSSKGEIPGNGLLECSAILRLGRKILIDEHAFFAWVRDKADVAGVKDCSHAPASDITRLLNGGR